MEYTPTKEELELINRKFAKKPYKSPNELHLFPAMIIDNQLTAYFTRVHPTFLEQCVRDLFNGVSFLVGHDRDKLPMARSFKGILTSNGDVQEVFAKFFMQKDLDVSGVNTDDFMRAFLGGTTEDVSIGFAAKRYECSICGNDIRSSDCAHWPGIKYNDKNEKDDNGVLCFAWVMVPGGPRGEALLEVSGVYKGAAPAAKQKKAADVPKFMLNLTEGKTLKEMPEEAAVALNFSFSFSGKGENMFDLNKFFAGEYKKEEIPENIDIDAILTQELSEGDVGRLKDKFKGKEQELMNRLKEYPASELLTDDGDGEYVRWTRTYINGLPDASFAVVEPAYTKGETANKNARHLLHHGGISNENLDLPHLRNALARMNQVKPVTISISTSELHSKAEVHLTEHKPALEGNKNKLQILETNNQVLLEQIDSLKVEINGYKQVITKAEENTQALKDANAQLQQEVKDLKIIAEDGKTYKKDLINAILELGIKLQGNKYDVETNRKMLEEPTTKLIDIKKIRDQFLQELEERFPRKQTQGNSLQLPDGGTAETPDDAFKLS